MRHPHTVAFDRGVEIAAALVLQVERMEHGEESAMSSAHIATLRGRRRYVNVAD
jgi:hypothetical protein